MENDLELTVLIPCLNEENSIGICIDKAINWMKNANVKGEVLVSDNGSTDKSIEISKERGARVEHIPVKGYGSALIGGINAAKGKYIIMGDADDSYDFSALDPFVDNLRKGHDVVMGNRFKGGIEKGAMPFLHKYLGNPVLTWIGNVLFKVGCGDFHCGLRGVNRKSILKLNLNTTGMEFASEMIIKSALNDFKIAEVPTKLYPDKRGRAPHLRTWRDGWRHLRFLLMYSPRWLFLYPGAFLGLISVALTSLSLNESSLGGFNLGMHTTVYSFAGILVAAQMINFAFMTKIFAMREGFLPEDKKLNKLISFVTLEKALIFGVILLFLGLGLSLNALSTWQENNFIYMNPLESMKIVIPGAMSIALGFGVIFSGFFYSILGIKSKDKTPPNTQG